MWSFYYIIPFIVTHYTRTYVCLAFLGGIACFVKVRGKAVINGNKRE